MYAVLRLFFYLSFSGDIDKRYISLIWVISSHKVGSTHGFGSKLRWFRSNLEYQNSFRKLSSMTGSRSEGWCLMRGLD